jgi:hypothetical protein
MRRSSSGQDVRVPLLLHGFESRPSLHVNRYYHPDDEDLSSGTLAVAQPEERGIRTPVIGVQVVTEAPGLIAGPCSSAARALPR